MKARDWIARARALTVLAALVSFVAVLPAEAQQAAAPAQLPAAGQADGLKIAVINGDRVLTESNIGVQVQQETQAEAGRWDTMVRGKQAELDGAIATLQQQQLTLTEDALARMQGQIEQLQVDLQRMRDDAQRALTRMAEEAQTRINNQLIPAVEQLAAQQGYDLILDTRIQGILYFADAIDATDRYIALVNMNYPLPEQNQQ